MVYSRGCHTANRGRRRRVPWILIEKSTSNTVTTTKIATTRSYAPQNAYVLGYFTITHCEPVSSDSFRCKGIHPLQPRASILQPPADIFAKNSGSCEQNTTSRTDKYHDVPLTIQMLARKLTEGRWYHIALDTRIRTLLECSTQSLLRPRPPTPGQERTRVAVT